MGIVFDIEGCASEERDDDDGDIKHQKVSNFVVANFFRFLRKSYPALVWLILMFSSLT